jgi:CRP-like cAMP-binding protein
MSDAPPLRHRENRLLATLSASTLTLLAPALQEVSASQGTVFLEPGAPIDRIYFPQSGMISLLVVTNGGDMIETASIGREGAVGLHAGFGRRWSLTRATVQVPGRFSTMTAQSFQEVTFGSIPIREMIARYTEVLWAETQQIAACNAIHDAASRLCRWLLQSADRIGGYQIPLTQEFLAQMLGVRRTTVTLLAQELQNKGMIKYSRGKITIVNRKGLEDCACECYHVIQHEQLPTRIGIAL